MHFTEILYNLFLVHPTVIILWFKQLNLFPLDTDECSVVSPCNQTCLNTNGSFECSCWNGYLLNSDRRSCRGEISTYCYLLYVIPNQTLMNVTISHVIKFAPTHQEVLNVVAVMDIH